MSENLALYREIISAPQKLPAYARESLYFTAWRHGFADASDGVRNLGTLEIRTPEEQEICKRPFTSTLRRLVGQDLPDGIASPLKIKAACGGLNHTEAAYALFAFGEETGIRDAILPQLKEQHSFRHGVFKTAHHLDLIKLTTENRFLRKIRQYNARSTITWHGQTISKQAKRSDQAIALSDACLKAYAGLADIQVAAIPAYNPVLSPVHALHAYVAEYGGRMPTAPTERTAREHLTRCYEQDLQGKIFYPNPSAALSDLYANHELLWRHTEEDGRCIATEMRVQRHRKRTDEFDVYTLWVEGPGQHAAQQAASRLILEHVGATDPTLLQRR